jgi:hypothetical protein
MTINEILLAKTKKERIPFTQFHNEIMEDVVSFDIFRNLLLDFKFSEVDLCDKYVRYHQYCSDNINSIDDLFISILELDS